MRPFRTFESGKLRIIRIINPGRFGHLQQWIPGLLARGDFILELFQAATMRETDENNFTTAGPNFFNSSGNIGKTFLNAPFHLLHEDFRWDVTRRRRNAEQRKPDLLDAFRQFTSGFGALLPHPGAALAILGCKVRWEDRRHLRALPVRDRYLVQKPPQADIVG